MPWWYQDGPELRNLLAPETDSPQDDSNSLRSFFLGTQLTITLRNGTSYFLFFALLYFPIIFLPSVV